MAEDAPAMRITVLSAVDSQVYRFSIEKDVSKDFFIKLHVVSDIVFTMQLMPYQVVQAYYIVPFRFKDLSPFRGPYAGLFLTYVVPIISDAGFGIQGKDS